MIKRLFQKLDEKLSNHVLVKILLLLMILFLLMETDQVWGTWAELLIQIMRPFVIGFIIAYILYPLVTYLEAHHFKKNAAVTTVLLLFLLLIVILMMILSPALYNKILEFFNSLAYAVQWITDMIWTYGEVENPKLLNGISDAFMQLIRESQALLPSITNTLPSIVNSFIQVLSLSLFSFIIAVYMLFDFERIKQLLTRFILIFFPGSRQYLSRMNQDVSIYIRSLLLLMIIKFFEYSLLYYLVGHNDWVIVGLLTSIGLIIPYFGATFANVIGILTALTLSPARFVALLIGIAVLSNIDGYVIGPMIHQKRSSLGPILSIFAVFAGGILAGITGITIAIPLVISIKSIYEVYNEEEQEI